MQKLYSIIIPARNDAARLRECLDALSTSLEESGPGEVIVVDDGSTDDTARVAAKRGARVVSLPGLGPAAARNRGAGVARGELLLFLDADCVPMPGYLEALIAPFRDPRVAGARGGYSTIQGSPLARFVQLEMEEKQARLAASEQVTLLDTACAAYRRSVFLEEGGFDERYPATSVEDAELSFRLAQRGRRLVYAPGALVRHRHPEGLGIYLRRKLRFGFFRAQLYGRYPSRLREDGYTPRAMPVQIALAGGMSAAAIASPWSGGARVGLIAGALAFTVSTLPMMRRAWRSDRPLTPLVPPMLLARSLAQGLGLLAGGIILGARAVGFGRRMRRPYTRRPPGSAGDPPATAGATGRREDAETGRRGDGETRGRGDAGGTGGAGLPLPEGSKPPLPEGEGRGEGGDGRQPNDCPHPVTVPDGTFKPPSQEEGTGLGTQDAGLDSESSTQHSEQNPGLRTQDSVPSTQDSGPRTQDPALSTQHSAPSPQHSRYLTLRSRWLGAAVSAGALLALGVLLRDANWTDVAGLLAAAQPGWLAAALGIALGVEVAKTARWQLLLGLGIRQFPRLLALLFTGRLLNLLAPLRAGDIWRVASVVKDNGRPVLVAGGTLVAEKLLDGVGLGVAGALLVSRLWAPPAWLFPSALPAALLLAALVIVFRRRAAGVETSNGDGTSAPRWKGASPFPTPWLGGGSRLIAAGLNRLNSIFWDEKAGPGGWGQELRRLMGRRLLASTLFLTAVGLGMGLLANLLVLYALGLAGWQPALAMLLAGYAAGLVPSGPGQLGVYEVAVSAPLVAMGMPAASAVAAALALHLVLLAGLVVGGVVAVTLSSRS